MLPSFVFSVLLTPSSELCAVAPAHVNSMLPNNSLSFRLSMGSEKPMCRNISGVPSSVIPKLWNSSVLSSAGYM